VYKNFHSHFPKLVIDSTKQSVEAFAVLGVDVLVYIVLG